MKIIRPTTITDALLTSSNAPETDYAAWSGATTYALGAHVISAVTHRRYESLQGANTNHAVSDPTWWLDTGPTNRWAMFDSVIGTLTVGAAGIDVTLTPGAADALAVVDTDAETVTVTMKQGATTVYSKTKSTNVGGSAILDWSAYFFEPIGILTSLTFLDLPVYLSATVRIQAEGPDPDGPVSIGTLIIGRQMGLGSTEAGPEVGINDFSRKETDDFGNTIVVQRPFSKRMTVRSMVEGGQSVVDAMQRELAKYRATPLLWIGEDGWDSLTILGFYKSFSLDLAFSHIAYCSLEIEGLI